MEFIEFLLGLEWRFYQERNLVLDLAHSGIWGHLAFSLSIASLTVFLIAAFHLIARRKVVALLLVSLGLASLSAGLTGSYVHFSALPQSEAVVIRDTAGPRPHTAGQQAAVVCLPLVIGGLNLTANVGGCLYLAVFWSAVLFSRGRKRKRG